MFIVAIFSISTPITINSAIIGLVNMLVNSALAVIGDSWLWLVVIGDSWLWLVVLFQK
jgi:superoxide dismutase